MWTVTAGGSLAARPFDMGVSVRRTAVVGLLGLVLAGCSGGEDSARDPAERLAAAASATTAAGTARTAVTVDTLLGEDGADSEVTLSAEGEVDFDARRAAAELRVPGIDEPLRTVVDGDVAYTRLPEVLGDEGAGWVRQEGYGAGAGMGFTVGAGVGGEDPTRLVEALASVEGEIAELGEETVREADADGYGFTLRGAALADEGGGMPQRFSELEIPAEAWLDADDRVRRLVATFDLAALTEAVGGGPDEPDEPGEAGEGGEGGDGGDRAEPDQPGEPAGPAPLGDPMALDGTLELTVELFDFGAEVDIAVPAADDVIDAEAFEQRVRHGAGG